MERPKDKRLLPNYAVNGCDALCVLDRWNYRAMFSSWMFLAAKHCNDGLEFKSYFALLEHELKTLSTVNAHNLVEDKEFERLIQDSISNIDYALKGLRSRLAPPRFKCGYKLRFKTSG